MKPSLAHGFGSIALLLLSVLTGAMDSEAKSKFRYIQPGEQIPKEKFIFILVHAETGKVHMGYSPQSTKVDESGKLSGGLRNGGHALLLFRALGLSPGDRNLAEKIPRQHKWAGGGFYVAKDGHTYIHPMMSMKAAGNSPGLGNTVNSRLPAKHSLWTNLVPEAYRERFLTSIARATGLPLKVDPNMYNSKKFVINRKKYPSALYQSRIRGDWIEERKILRKEIASINSEVFGTKPSVDAKMGGACAALGKAVSGG